MQILTFFCFFLPKYRFSFVFLPKYRFTFVFFKQNIDFFVYRFSFVFFSNSHFVLILIIVFYLHSKICGTLNIDTADTAMADTPIAEEQVGQSSDTDLEMVKVEMNDSTLIEVTSVCDFNFLRLHFL